MALRQDGFGKSNRIMPKVNVDKPKSDDEEDEEEDGDDDGGLYKWFCIISESHISNNFEQSCEHRSSSRNTKILDIFTIIDNN